MRRFALRASQAGFTLIELMVALTVGSILMLVVVGLFFDLFRSADFLLTKVRLNQEAREIFDFAAMGGTRSNVNVAAGTPGIINDPTSDDVDYDYLFGLRGRASNTSNSLCTNTGNPDCGWGWQQSMMAVDGSAIEHYRFLLSPNSESPNIDDLNAYLVSSEIPDFSVSCRDVDIPLDDCTAGGTGDGIVVKGYLASDPNPSSATRIVPITVNLIDIVRTSGAIYVVDEITSAYWNAFTLNVD